MDNVKPSGPPLKVAGDGDLKELVAEAGSMTYLLGTKAPKTAKGDPGPPRLFKLIKNVLGWAVVEIEDNVGNLPVLSEQVGFGLPLIPAEMVQRIDEFFRGVYDKLGTEAIVLLTYDPRVLESDDPTAGWGVLVPEQENDPAACDYRRLSVMEEKDDEVQIVGTCHSHPGMSAFCSGTDARDQQYTDGLHITFAWSRGSLFTDYHVELQLGGKRFTRKPEDVFADRPGPELSADVQEWMKRVSRSVPASYSWNGGNTGYAGKKEKRKFHLPKGCPEPTDASVIADMLEGEVNCPCCKTRLMEFDSKRRRCFQCMTYLVGPDESLDDMRAARKLHQLFNNEIDPAMEPRQAIVHWQRDKVDGKYDEAVVELWPGTKGTTLAEAGKAEVSKGKGKPKAA